MVSQSERLIVGPRSFRLFDPESPGTSDAGPGDISPSMSLSEFFDGWFLPVVLRSRGESGGTETVYRDALAWWTKLTGDPPIRQIDEYTVATFAEGLRSAKYRRGKLGPGGR